MEKKLSILVSNDDGIFSDGLGMLVKELQHYGILSVLTSPENLTVNTINKYLELKARQAV